jgi:Leucine-rich repeat (LRR) protein
MERLRFEFSQSLSLLAYDELSSSLSALLPNLTHLCLRGCTSQIVPSMLQNLPRVLEILSIHPSNLFPPGILKAADFQYLPKGITKLSLKNVIIGSVDDEWKHLPQGLKHLSLADVSELDLISQLPPLVECLKLRFTHKMGPRPHSSVAVLPSSLRHFFCNNLHFVLDSPLPPHLEQFSCSLSAHEASWKTIQDLLPISLRVLPPCASNIELLNDRVSERFPNLDKFMLTHPQTEALLQSPSPNFFDQGFPPKLTTLFIPHIGPPHYHKLRLPPTLKILQVGSIAPSLLRCLPASLQVLQLEERSYIPHEPIGPSDWALLPSGLVSLSCEIGALGPIENLKYLHRLEAFTTLLLSGCTVEWLSNPSLSSIWPTRLESLRISGSHLGDFEWMASLSSLPRLTDLTLSGSLTQSLPNNHLEKVPRGLRQLRIHWIPTEGFGGLPSTLEKLNVIVFGGPSAGLDSLQGLPTELRSLTVSSLPLLTTAEELLPKLPKRISSLSLTFLGSQERKNLLQEYYSDPQWEGAFDLIQTTSFQSLGFPF